MEYCLLGKSDVKVSRIGYGTMSLEPDNPVSEHLLLKALDGGINYFDTADMYQQGKLESLLGRCFQGRRLQVILASKVGNQWRPDGSGWDWNPNKKYLLSAVDQSLKRLRTDYIDLYQLHGGTMDDPIDEVIEAFESMKKSGKIRNYGISSIRPAVIREYVKRSNIVSVMMQYSLLDRRPEEEMFPFLKENQVGVLARGSLAKGLLIDKPLAPYLNYGAEEVRKAALAIQHISSAQRQPAATAIRFCLQHPAVTSAVIGIRTENQLENALDAMITDPLTDQEMQVLENSISANYFEQHR